MDSDASMTTFWGHVGELRSTLIKAALIAFSGILLAFFFYDPLFTFLTSPLSPGKHLQRHRIETYELWNVSNKSITYELQSNEYTSPSREKMVLLPNESVTIQKRIDPNRLLILGPVEGFSTMCKVCFWFGVVITSPLWLYTFFLFIFPALQPGYRSLILPFLASSALFFTLGLVYSFFIMIPLANNYLSLLNSTMGENYWSLSNYLQYTVFLSLASGLAFELALIGLYCVHFGLFTPDGMREKRRHMTVAAFVIGALLTPPDILTQFMLAIPLMIFYELAILYGSFRETFAKTPYPLT